MTQDFLVYLIVAVAVGYLVRVLWQSATSTRGCGCGSGNGCPKAKTARVGTPTDVSQAPPASGLIQINVNGSNHNAERKADHRSLTTGH